MNKHFRLAIVKDLPTGTENVIDLTRYDITAQEPKEHTRQWRLLDKINQKQTRAQDVPIYYHDLSQENKAFVASFGIKFD